MRSAVKPWSWVKDAKAAVVGRGIDSPRVTSNGISSSINSSSGGSDNGEKSGYARDCKSLV